MELGCVILACVGDLGIWKGVLNLCGGVDLKAVDGDGWKLAGEVPEAIGGAILVIVTGGGCCLVFLWSLGA